MIYDPALDDMHIIGRFRVTAPASPAMPADGYPMKVFTQQYASREVPSGSTLVFSGGPYTRHDLSDIAFITDRGQILPHQVLVPCDAISTYSTIELWVKIPYMLPNTFTNIWVLAGNRTCDRNNGDKTFSHWSDFKRRTTLNSPDYNAFPQKYSASGDVSLLNGICTIKGNASSTGAISQVSQFAENFAVRARFKTLHYNNSLYDEVFIWYSAWMNYIGFIPTSSNTPYNLKIRIADSTTEHLYDITGWSADTYHIMEIIRNGSTNITVYVDNTLIATCSANLPTGPMYVSFNAAAAAGGTRIDVDWFLTRPFMSTEPTISQF